MNTYQPFTAVFGRKENDLVIFNRLDSEVSIANPDGYTWEFLCLCNGQRTIEEITEKFPVERKKLIESIFITLKNEKIIFDSRELFNFFHNWSSVPMQTNSDLSEDEIVKLCKQKVKLPDSLSVIDLVNPRSHTHFSTRQSVRDFTGEAISLPEISSILFAMYGKDDFSATPSAGGLYASIIYCVLLKNGEGIDPGVYAYNRQHHQLNKVDCLVSIEKMVSIFGSRSIQGAGAIFFLTADVSRIADKYSNRGYRFALLEAGHIAQNAYLAVTGTRLGLCEYGGFSDEEVSAYLRLDAKRVLPLTSIVAGVKSGSVLNDDSYDSLFKKLQNEVLEKQSIVDSVSYTLRGYAEYKMSVYVAETIKGSGKNIDYCLGTGLTPNEAMSKALAESYERFISAQTRVDIEGVLPLNSDVLNLCNVCSQQESYLKYFGMIQKERIVTHWTKGFRFLGGDAYVPADQVYFPIKLKSGDVPMYLSNSTGVAAHQSENEAIQSAFLELVERDAIGVHWYARKVPDRIDPTSDSSWIAYRVKEIEKIKRSITFVKLTIDLTPVVMCFITGDIYPYCVTGSSSAKNHMQACEKALTEAEITLVSFLHRRKRVIEKEKVWSVEDHAKFLAGSNQTHFGWFLEGDIVSIPTADSSCLSVEESLAKINPVVVSLNRDEDKVLFVVRVLSEKLLPITFGYGSEHYGHRRLNDVGLSWGEYPASPHPLA